METDIKLYIVSISFPDDYPDADERHWSTHVEAADKDEAERIGKQRFLEAGAPDDLDWSRWLITVSKAA